jgi:cellulose 1,4-beta-cellobiosidase
MTLKIMTVLGTALAVKASQTNPRLLDFPIQRCTEGGCTTEDTKLTLDANWRWYYHPDNYQNCFDNGYTCGTDASCADCILTGDVDYGAYGIETQGDEVTLNFRAQNGGIGSRVYVLKDGQYKMFDLLNQEISMDVDISALGCGLNGAVYFSEMESDGGESKGSQGAEFGTGYCDAQCPDDLHQVDGKVNFENKHQCCNEMDIWEANGISNALTPHTCQMPNGDDMIGPVDCTGSECGEGAERYESICDKNGCDLNPYRFGKTDFYGPGKQVDTNRKFTITTSFLTDSNGDLAEIRRTYYQEDESTGEMIEIATPPFELDGNTFDSITDAMCTAVESPSPQGFDSLSTFMDKGGLKEMGDSFSRGMTLVLSLWDDVTSDMLWLDGTAEANGESPSKYGAARGPCTAGIDRNSAEARAAYVKYSNIRYGDLGTTSPVTSTTIPSSTTTLPVTTAATTASSSTASPTTTTTTSGTTGTDSDCGFQIDDSCWNEGCAVRLNMDVWTPNQLISFTLAEDANVKSAWNSKVVSQEGRVVTVQLASYNSDSWGFNQGGSGVLPSFPCGSGSNPSGVGSISNPSTTEAPTTTTGSPTETTASNTCSVVVHERCWASGCTVEVTPQSWVPGARFGLQLADNTQVTNIWNAAITSTEGTSVEIQLANYNSNSFGFNQRGSDVLPKVFC